MADIVVRGMNAPESCAKCQVNCDMFLSGYLNGFAEGAYKRHPACPILALPEKHGRLIDADELLSPAHICNIDDSYERFGIQVIPALTVRQAPTIVPAEKEEENV